MPSDASGERLVSLDFYRGLTMLFLTAESTHLFDHFVDPSLEGTFLFWIGTQCHHVPWEGLRFWDLIQPFFMFIVGVALPFSLANRRNSGQTSFQRSRHAFQRSLTLLFLGWALYCIGPGEITFRFQNVLAQLSVTYLVAFLLMDQKATVQLIVSFGLLLLTELIYRAFPVEGFNHPFTPNENFGTWLDIQYGGENLGGHWVSFNAIPTTAHTIWGVLAGQLLLSSRSANQKLKILILAGMVGLLVGYGLSPITPMIKRTATSTFVMASGGWALLALAASYWLIDVMYHQKWAFFGVVVGMNPLFIYLFCHIGGAEMVRKCVYPFVTAMFGSLDEIRLNIAISSTVLFCLWYLCYWLYQRKVFIRI